MHGRVQRSISKSESFSRRVKLDKDTRNDAKVVSPGEQADRRPLSFAKRPDTGLPTRNQMMGTSPPINHEWRARLGIAAAGT